MPARFGSMVGTARGRLLAGVLALPSLLLFAVVGLGPLAAQRYPALRFLLQPILLMALAVVAAGLLITAGWLVARTRPASIVLRILTGLIAIALLGVTVAWGTFIAGFSSTVEREEVLAVSADGRFKVVREDTRGWKNTRGTELRVRTRAGLLSRDADRELVSCQYPQAPGRIDADFVGERTVRLVVAGEAPVTVTFDAESMRPERTILVCFSETG